MRMTLDELRGWIDSACMDMGMDRVSDPRTAAFSPEKIRHAEWEAEKMLDDPQLLADMIGDHIYGCENRDDLICELHDLGGTLADAAEIMIERM